MKLPSYQELSKEQDKINTLPLDGSFLVVGPPGTGKTVMALYRAQMLAKKREEFWVLMHSRLLKQYTEDAADELDIRGEVNTFHRWIFGFWYEQYGKKYPSLGRFQPDWVEMLSMVNRNPPPKASLPHLIVDEGQDFAKEFFQVARYLTPALTVFADENQRLAEHNSRIQEIADYGLLDSVHNLTRNYRNTREIAALAAYFYTGLKTGIAAPPDRSGDMPVLQKVANAASAAEFIAKYEKSRTNKDIGVLVPNKHTLFQLAGLLKGQTKRPAEVFVGGKGARAEQLSFGEPGIKLICYQSAKGLEFDTVFLPELQNYKQDPRVPDFKMMMYVLISRARHNLFMMYSGDGIPPVVEALPRQLLEVK